MFHIFIPHVETIQFSTKREHNIYLHKSNINYNEYFTFRIIKCNEIDNNNNNNNNNNKEHLVNKNKINYQI